MPSSWIPDASSQPIDRGYAVSIPDTRPDKKGKRTSGANAFLRMEDGATVGMWVYEVTADFSIGYASAQSPAHRDTYPHNFVQPHITIKGQGPNQREYYRLTEFVRQSQLDAVLDFPYYTPGRVGRILKFGCFPPHRYGPDPNPNNAHVKGRPPAIIVDGFIASITKATEWNVNAPEYQFDFIVTNVNHWLGLSDNVLVPFQTDSITARMEAGRPRTVVPRPSRKKNRRPPTHTQSAGGQTAIDVLDNPQYVVRGPGNLPVN